MTDAAPGGLEYLVDIKVHLPGELTPERRAELLAAELRRGRELKAAGSIAMIWRVPGAVHNIGIWRAPDPTALHDLIASLPLFPFIDATVTPLARHPIDSPS
jgi:muconolactone D-isomerase